MLASNFSKLFDSKLLAKTDKFEETFYHYLKTFSIREKWEIHRTPPWLHVQSLAYILPAQGWKLHITATPQNAVKVLESCLPILFQHQAWFKFILTKPLLHVLNAAHAPRMSSGKFITIYPQHLEACRALAAACHGATISFKGPTILSDKPFKPGSSVYYRYGAFKAFLSYGVDGRAVYVFHGTDGKVIEDIRSVSSRQPDWAEDPFIQTQSSQSTPRSSVLLNERYTVTHALQHANKGGVYLAQDAVTGENVVVKEARPNVESDDLNRDVTDRLNQEFRNLRLLYSLGIVPRPIELFTQSGHHFMVMEWVQGVTLRQYVTLAQHKHRIRLPRRQLLTLCRKVAHLLHLCHSANIVIRDFTPNNIMLRPGGRLTLIDTEMACPPGEPEPLASGEGTFAYASPQQIAQTPPAFSDDYFSLGAILFFLATLSDPLFPSDEPRKRSLDCRIAEFLDSFTQNDPIPSAVLTSILKNLQESPQDRWPADKVLAHLSQAESGSRERPTKRIHRIHRGDLPPLRHVVKEVARHITESLDFSSSSRPMPSTCFGEQTYLCNIQHGTAGIGLSLISLARSITGSSGSDTLRSLCDWTLNHRQTTPADPPGLYFGTAGTAWFLLEAADLLHDGQLHTASVALAQDLPCEPPIADVTHGAAGIGLTFIKFFLRTGELIFIEKARAIANHLISRFSFSHGGSLLWSKSLKPEREEPSLGEVFYGFAHGIAGISYFLLCLSLIDNDVFLLDIVDRSAESLFEAASFEGPNLYWPHGPTNSTKWPFWCNGTSGVGTFLLRYAIAKRSKRAASLALRSCRAIMHGRWGSSLGQCHGIAGNAEYLLDLAHFTGEKRFADAAAELAEIIGLHRIYRSSGITFPDDTGFPSGLDFSIGAAGVGSFLSRVITRFPRVLMLDELFEDRILKVENTFKRIGS
jgi:serine/threonine protein kinase